jgi:hypothetical protein
VLVSRDAPALTAGNFGPDHVGEGNESAVNGGLIRSEVAKPVPLHRDEMHHYIGALRGRRKRSHVARQAIDLAGVSRQRERPDVYREERQRRHPATLAARREKEERAH